MRLKKITTSANDVLQRGFRVKGARLVSDSDNSTALLFDEAGGVAGDEFVKLVVSAGTGEDHPGSDVQMFGNGFFLNNALSVTISGTSSVLYIYYE